MKKKDKARLMMALVEIFHYVVLVGLIIGFYHLMGVHAVHANLTIVAGLFLVLAIGDQLVHRIFGLP